MKSLFPYALASLVVALFFVLTLESDSSLNTPPQDWDGVYYESLALGLLEGKGFAPRLDNEFASAYEGLSFITSGLYAKQLLEEGIDSTTTYRPPLFPLTIAALYSLFGRSFLAVHILQICFLAASVFVLARALQKLSRPRAAIFLILPFLTDPGIPALIVGPLTEPLMMLLMSLFLYWALLSSEERSWKYACAAGIALGLATMTRSAVALLIFLVPCFLSLWSAYQGRLRDYLRRGAAPMVAAALITVLPWAIRNCYVTGSFMPLGSHSGIFLGQLYQDSILRAGGYWTFENDWDPAGSVPEEIVGIEREKALAQQGLARARTWIHSNMASMPFILWERIREFWWPERRPDQKILTLALLGALILTFRNRENALFGLLASTALSYSLTILLTTNDYAGRYFYTIFPLAALSLALLLDAVTRRLLSIVGLHDASPLPNFNHPQT